MYCNALSSLNHDAAVRGAMVKDAREEERKRRESGTYPYATPAMVHFLNCITLQVRVPVLSEKMYFTCVDRGGKTIIYSEK